MVRFHSGKWSLLWFLPFLLGCNTQWTEALPARKASQVMCKETFTSSWTMTGLKDPYMPDKVHMPQNKPYPTLVFFGDGHFLSYDQYNLSTGNWFLNKEGNKIAFVTTRANGAEIAPSRSDSLFRYQILHQSNDSLILGIQGRHGLVKEYYAITQSQ